MLEDELLLKWLKVSRIIRNDSLLNEKFENKITYNEVLVLASIVHSESEFMPFSDVLNSTKMLKSQLNRTINSLEKKNLIVRRVNSEDKRKQEVKITLLGKSLLSEIKKSMLQIVEHFISVMGEEDSKALSELFSKIIAKQDDLLGD